MHRALTTFSHLCTSLKTLWIIIPSITLFFFFVFCAHHIICVPMLSYITWSILYDNYVHLIPSISHSPSFTVHNKYTHTHTHSRHRTNSSIHFNPKGGKLSIIYIYFTLLSAMLDSFRNGDDKIYIYLRLVIKGFPCNASSFQFYYILLFCPYSFT